MITARRDCQVHELGVRKNEGRSAGLVFLVDILDEHLKFQLLVIVWILGSWSSQAWATTLNLNYDQPTSGSIASVAQTNSYSFTADKDDVLNFTVVATKSICRGEHPGPHGLLHFPVRKEQHRTDNQHLQNRP
jgi:hypothetical protein